MPYTPSFLESLYRRYRAAVYCTVFVALTAGVAWGARTVYRSLGDSAIDVGRMVFLFDMVSVGYLVLLALMTLSLWSSLYHRRDLETLFALPLSDTQRLRYKLRRMERPSLPAWGLSLAVVWAICWGIGGGAATWVALPLLLAVNYAAFLGIAVCLSLWWTGRGIAVGLLIVLPVALLMILDAGSSAHDHDTTLTLLVAELGGGRRLPPRWALDALFAGDGRTREMAEAFLATAVLAAVAWGTVLGSLPWTWSLERLLPRFNRPARRRGYRSRAASAAASWLAGRMKDRTRSILVVATRSPAPERRLELLLPLLLLWIGAGLAARALAPLGDSLRGTAGCFTAASMATIVIFWRLEPETEVRGDLRYPPIQILPVSFEEHFLLKLLSNLTIVAVLALVILSFFSLNPVPGWIPAGLLSVGLWLAVADALGNAVGPQEPPSRPSQKRQLLLVAAALLVFGVCAFSASGPLKRLVGFIAAHGGEALLASYLLLPPLAAVGYVLGRKNHRKRWFDVEHRLVNAGALARSSGE